MGRLSAILDVNRNVDKIDAYATQTKKGRRNNRCIMMATLKQVYDARPVHHVGFASTGYPLTSLAPNKHDDKASDSENGSLGLSSRRGNKQLNIPNHDVMLRNSEVIRSVHYLTQKSDVKSEVTLSTSTTSMTSMSSSDKSMLSSLSTTKSTTIPNARRELIDIYLRGARVYDECLLKHRDSSTSVKEAVIRKSRSTLAHLDIHSDLLALGDDESIGSLDDSPIFDF